MNNLKSSYSTSNQLVKTKAGKYRINKAVSKDELLDMVTDMLRAELRREAITSSALAQEYLRFKLANIDYETFHVIYLDTQHQVIDFEQMFRGTINKAPVYPREIAKQCLVKGAHAVILAHNHPSGVAEPSKADIAITNDVVDVLRLLDVHCLDHLIFAAGQTCSLAQLGYV